MARKKSTLRTFNRGLISSLALARTDLDRVAQSAETMNNWMPRNLGSMMLRPGWAYLGASASNNQAKHIPFVYANADTALVEVTNQVVRVWESDSLVTRPTVTATVSNGTFPTDLTGWTDADTGGSAASTQVTESGSTHMKLLGDGSNFAARYQEVTVNEASTVHALAIQISRGPVTLKVGSTAGDDDYISETALDEGYHSLALTPTGNFFIQFENDTKWSKLVTSVAVESAGVMTITAPWLTADLDLLRYDQTGDIIFIACAKTTDDIGYSPYKIERRGAGSWSVVKYMTTDGPYLPINDTSITLTPSALTGDITLTAPQNVFKSTSVGQLYQLVSNGQEVSTTDIDATGADVFTETIKVFGAANNRIFTITIADRVNSTVTLQRSFTGSDGTFSDVTTFTADQVATYDDQLDNQEAWYKIGVKTADYGSDAIDLELSYPAGNIVGDVRITQYTSATSVTGVVTEPLGGTDATVNWYEGRWSDRRGWPTAVQFIEGRLVWFGRGKVDASVSDSYYEFDQEVIGDSGPISRTIGSGPTEKVNWVVELDPPVFGTDGKEHTLRSSSQNEILTPTNASVRGFASQGSARVNGLKVDDTAVFVQKGGNRLMQCIYDVRLTYTVADLSRLYPESGGTGIKHIAVQRQPDTRIHCLRNDGTVAVLVFDAAEEIACWVTVSAASPRPANYTYSALSNLQLSGSIRRRQIFYNNGYNMLSITNGFSIIYGYRLSSAYDITTLEVTGQTFDFSSEIAASSSMDAFVGNDGTKLYIGTNVGSYLVYEYDFGTAWDISTLTYTGNTFDVSVAVSQIWGMFMSELGTELYIQKNDGKIYQFLLTVPWDITTAAYDAVADFGADTATAEQAGIFISSNGITLYLGSRTNLTVYVYSLSTAWDVTTAGSPVLSHDLSAAPLTTVLGPTVTPSGDKLIVTSGANMFEFSASGQTGVIEDIQVLPGATGSSEDSVYYSVKRTINGSTLRSLEKWALESECVGGTTSKNLDSHIVGTVTSGNMYGLDHLEGEDVSVWVNGVDAGSYPVISGAITGVTTSGSAVVGLSYTAQFKSTKLGELTEKETVMRLGVIAESMHYQGLTYGPDFDNLDPLPLVEDGAVTAANTVHVTYDQDSFTFDGYWNTDNRICLQAQSPRPVTLLALTVDFEE